MLWAVVKSMWIWAKISLGGILGMLHLHFIGAIELCKK